MDIPSKVPYDSGFTIDRIKTAQARLVGSSSPKLAAKAEVPYPSVNEPALVHPWNNSVVKVRDNGNIDVFAGSDNGIRINPTTKTIDVFAETEKTHVNFIRAYVKRDETREIEGNWKILCSTAEVQAKKDIVLKAGGDIQLEAGGTISQKEKVT